MADTYKYISDDNYMYVCIMYVCIHVLKIILNIIVNIAFTSQYSVCNLFCVLNIKQTKV